MLFSSMTFVFMFLPILLLLYLITKKELHNPILLIASIIFYAWGEPRFLAIMLITILINYLAAINIEKFKNKRKQILILTIIINLGILFYFKYLNFLLSTINDVFHSNINFIDIIMPIGISFYTFQALSYVIDVYRGESKPQKDIYKLALYICLFPQLIAGPIIKYHDIEKQIDSREVSFERVSFGTKRFIVGLSKKVIIANTMAAIADKVFIQEPNTFPHIVAWLGAFAYSLQLYFDFSGYSDMAIGLGMIFGFKFMENFNYPYISKSITEFWRRWHISLSTWFKQYVYIPLGGNKKGLVKTCINLGAVFLLTGIWHGAAWTFIVWGVFQGVFIIIEKIFNIQEFDKKPHSIKVNILRHLYCILVFVAGWVIFRSENLQYAISYLMNMFGILDLDKEKFIYTVSYYFSKGDVIIFIFAILCCTPLFKNMLYVKSNLGRIIVNFWLLILFFISAASLVANTCNPFIYFRF